MVLCDVETPCFAYVQAGVHQYYMEQYQML